VVLDLAVPDLAVPDLAVLDLAVLDPAVLDALVLAGSVLAGVVLAGVVLAFEATMIGAPARVGIPGRARAERRVRRRWSPRPGDVPGARGP
jgi:hypothetical protein